MLTTFAHLGHDHSNTHYPSDVLSNLDPYVPLVVGGGLVIATLLLFILYFLKAWQPKPKAATKSKSTKTKSSSSKPKPSRKTK